jgi:BMFP domain-containing protein YqiC|tara:strand:- start:293 stop:526 length:234 start_codon:yes stop_codon:yes gene_type:complete
MRNNNFEDWGRKLSSLLPESASQVKQDIEKNIKVFVKDAIHRMDLVKRSELEEIQSKQVNMLSKLEQRIKEIEERVK